MLSFTIEYNKEIFYDNIDGQRIYFYFARLGDNNVYDDKNNRAKSWYFIDYGTHEELWKLIGKHAGAVEGGDIQKCVGWLNTNRFTIEEYIEAYRKKFRNAKKLQDFLNKFFISPTININDKSEITTEEEKILWDFIKKYGMQECGSNNRGVKKYRMIIEDYGVLLDFLLNMPERRRSEYYHWWFFIKKYTRQGGKTKVI